MRHARLAPVLLMIAALALGVAYWATPASAETITVTRDDDPTPDGCANNGCTFREAADLGNTTPGNQIVDVPDGMTVVLDSQINLSGDLTISGHGVDVSVIRSGTGAQLFDIAFGADVTFSNVWLYGANLTGAANCGGAIYNEGTLHVDHSRIAKNFVNGNGAGLCNNGTAFLDDVYMSANTANGGPGGAIFNGGTITITNSTITQNNVSGSDGGGIANGDAGTMTIQYSEISHNTVASNACDDCASGGGISSNGALTIEWSTISNNIADNGAGLINRGDAQIHRSTFTGNQAGAIKNSHGMMLVIRSTISANLASPYPDSGVGGIENYATLSLVNDTIADNGHMQFQYGGLFTNTTASTDYKATIFANNGPKNCSTSGSQSSGGYNVFAGVACTAVGTDQTVTDAMILALANNGGPTLTNMPAPGSPAVDHGSPSCPSPDQRGALLIPPCDAGAVEYGGIPITPTPSPSPTTPPIAYPMGDPTCSDSVAPDDLVPELKLAAGLAQPDTCGRETIQCLIYAGACYPVWVNTNCDEKIDARDVLPIAAHLAGVPMTIGQCTPVGQYPAAN